MHIRSDKFDFVTVVAAGLLAALALGPAQAQQPTSAQASAIRASCRSDFMTNCSGVQPGGRDALECLQRNVAKLSPSCKTAVSATMPAPAAPAPAAVASPPATAPAPAAAAPATTSPAPAKRTETPPAAPHPARQPSGVAARPANAPTTATQSPAPPPAPAVAPLNVRPFLLPRRRVEIVAICRADAQRLCGSVPPGGGRVIECLAANAPSLSPICYDAIARVSR